MKVLWDFRLFSHGFARRGVGRYTAAVAGTLLEIKEDLDLYIWGDRAAVPQELLHPECVWIPYRKSSWKQSIVSVPVIACKYQIDIVHYWIALGPQTAIGIAPLLTCPSVATVYDAGIEKWNLPHGNFLRTTPYWKMQRFFFRSIQGVMTISEAAMVELSSVVSFRGKNVAVVYPPLPQIQGVVSAQPAEREKLFLVLGGSPHKNVRSVLEAFTRFKKNHPEFFLVIIGELDLSAEEIATLFPEGVRHEPSMEMYPELLSRCGALVYCSFHEGLGLPPLEAMACGAPVLVSAIPPLRETCGRFAFFADPYSISSIEAGMEEVTRNPENAQSMARAGAARYTELSGNVPRRCIDLYREVLIGKKGGGKG